MCCTEINNSVVFGGSDFISAALPLLYGVGKISAEEQVPGGQKMDGVVVLEPLELVVDGVEGGVVAEEPVERITPGEPTRAVIVHVLHGQHAEEDCRRPGRHA